MIESRGKKYNRIRSSIQEVKPLYIRGSGKRGQGREDTELIFKCDTYTVEYLLSPKKNEIMPCAATWMQLEILILNEVSQKEKDKYHMVSLICGI